MSILCKSEKKEQPLNKIADDIYIYIYIYRPFNPWPGSSYETTKWEQIELFSQVVMGGGIPCTTRRPRGKGNLSQDIICIIW